MNNQRHPRSLMGFIPDPINITQFACPEPWPPSAGENKPVSGPQSHLSDNATTRPSDPSQFLDEKLLESAARLFDTVDGED